MSIEHALSFINIGYFNSNNSSQNTKSFISLPFEKRLELATSMREKYPSRIPVIIISKKLEITKIKYLVPDDISFAQFQLSIRKNLPNLKKEQSIFFFVNNNILNNTSIMSSIYNEHKNKDQFLYIQVCIENVFG